jgi:tetratricopeptide (TPR) repeat protein
MRIEQIQNPNDAWVIHREEAEALQNGPCDIYVLLDAISGYCFGQEVSANLPSAKKMKDLITKAISENSVRPKKILILKKDPLAQEIEEICNQLDIPFEAATQKEIDPFTSVFSEAFQDFKYKSRPNFDDEEFSQEELKAFIPETYGPCPCVSGKKFKFCCQKIFKNITFAMCEAQDGHLEKALFYMKQAEEKVGLTSEVLCRIAICWSYFDREKSSEFLEKSLKLNPNHPRTNYILGIEAVEKKDYLRAVKYYQTAINNHPHEDKFHLNETYNNMGTAYFYLKNFKMAKESWEKSLVCLPSDKTVRRNLYEFIYLNETVPKEIREISPFIEKYLNGK